VKALNADEYWQSYYADEFIFGMGTEEIIAMLAELPPVRSWIDLGSGSESLLWGAAIEAERLVAVDYDPERLELLKAAARSGEPRGAYRTALELAGRSVGDWPALGARISATYAADCLNGEAPIDEQAELVTQFGLLGLCADRTHFRACFEALAALAEPGGWIAGANWLAADLTGRVAQTEDDYVVAMAASDVDPVTVRRIESADPAYPSIWAYVGHKRPDSLQTPASYRSDRTGVVA
jgi:hypothetical protein